jgi:diaminopimelate decarboxylase
MSAPPRTVTSQAAARARCEGIVALPARLEPWQLDVCGQPELVDQWLGEHGSPVNLLDPAPMARNAAELRDAAQAFGIELGIYFARKANKALCIVDEARRLGLGVDVASERELTQVLERGIPGSALVMTAAVKPEPLLQLCIASGTAVVLDNADELRRLARLAEDADRVVSVALRLAPAFADDRLPTRFGFDPDEALAVLAAYPTAGLRIDGVQFHLDGYLAADRVTAIDQALLLVDALRMRGHAPAFLDIGGGIPMSYIDDPAQWERFWDTHRAALLGHGPALTFDGHGLGLLAHDGEIVGRRAVYPFHQSPTRGDWLAEILRAPLTAHDGSVAGGLLARGLELRCEPGRALLDGCGLTAARVSFRKQRRDGTWLIGVEMNRTQCRSTSDDFLVDPLLLHPDRGEAGDRGARPTGPIEGYLVGAYCIERELLSWRRLRFAHGVDVGDIVVFPNTAGYLMHILESSSHQIPLARNLLLGGDGAARLDPIDRCAK